MVALFDQLPGANATASSHAQAIARKLQFGVASSIAAADSSPLPLAQGRSEPALTSPAWQFSPSPAPSRRSNITSAASPVPPPSWPSDHSHLSHSNAASSRMGALAHSLAQPTSYPLRRSSHSGPKAHQTSAQFVRYGLPADASPAATQSSSRSSRVYRVPRSTDTSDEEDEGDAQSRAPTGLSRSSPLQQPTQRRQAARTKLSQVPDSISLGGPLEQQLLCLQLQLKTSIQVETDTRNAEWNDAWQQADRKLEEQLRSISSEIKSKGIQLQKADDRLKAEGQQERDQRLEQLQKLHQESAAVQRQQVANLQRQVQEEAERRAAEVRRQQQQQEEEQRRRQAEEEQRKQEERRVKEEADKKLKEEQDRKAAAAQAAAAQAASAAAAPTGQQLLPTGAGAAAPSSSAAGAVDPNKASAAARCMRVSPEAALWDQAMQKRMAELEAVANTLLKSEDPAVKKQVRDLSKKINVHVQQISATLDQVSKKCQHIFQLIRSQPDAAWRTLAMYQFVVKVCKQDELILQNNRAAFPIATVVVKLSTQFPELMDLMVGALHREMPVAVPMAFVHDPALLTTAQYYRLMGFKELEGKDKGGPKVFESVDDVVRRTEGLMLLYGAIVQVDEPTNPHGLDHGWRWLARALNSLPADRITSKALASFLRTGGFGLHRRFRGQLIKLLRCMNETFVPELAMCRDPDVQPTRTQLEFYYTNRQYLKEPEGRAMPNVDESAYFDA